MSKDKKEALELFEKHGQVKEINAFEWRHWQKKMLQYVNNPTQRKVIWLVGEKGNEGKTFFQHKIEEQYGMHRVCALPLSDSSTDILKCMRAAVSMTTDIFLFNIPRCFQNLSDEHYKMLESIKDGKELDGKYIRKKNKMRFTTPNVLIVFSTREPDRDRLCNDRWIILKISEDLTGLTEITDDCSGLINIVK